MPRTPRPLAMFAACAIGASCLALGPLTPATAAPPEPATPAAQGPAVPAGGVRINEVESNGGVPGDWIELFNASAAPADLSGVVVKDGDDSHAFVLPAGTMLAPGGFLVLDERDKTGVGDFDFGLGKDDHVRLFDSAGVLLDSVSWGPHAATTLGRTGAGEWRETSQDSKGTANVFAADPEVPGTPGAASSLRLSEVDSQPADWVELVNTGTEPLDIAGFELRDNSDDHSWRFPAGSTIAGGAYLVVDENSVGQIGGGTGLFSEAIGIGSADQIRLFDQTGGQLDDSGAWTAHAALDGDAAKATLARCAVSGGPFVLAHPTPGAANLCVTDSGEGGTEQPPLVTRVWPGSPSTTAIDTTPMFLEDSSGLDTQVTSDGVVLWAVDNGEGRFWKLNVAADGTAKIADGWADGKRARFQKDAANPRAAGPDTEGITAANDGFLYLASERDNSAKGVNFNAVLQIDPEAAGPDVVATVEWDLTGLLPQVSANLGIEAVEWVSDADLANKLVDANTGAGYDPEIYPLHGDGLFFVAVEDGGQVFAFALNSDGTAQRVAEVRPGLPGVMSLDYDTVLGGLWAACDDGCDGASAFITLNGTEVPAVAHYARPASLPNTNNEGFATAPAALVTADLADAAGAAAAVSSPSVAAAAADGAGAVAAGSRPVWWFTDGVQSAALHAGSLDVSAVDPGEETPGGENPETPGGENPELPGTPSTPSTPGTPPGQVSQHPGGPSSASPTAATLAETGGISATLGLLGAAAVALLGGAVLVFGRRGAHTQTTPLPVLGE
ncbi:lamin tail domain-containing protein [Leucobacter luti]|uniref:lamin tail domain-containing protein n=1 Tax=Leucobacter luti TaxID=340320 RepID=UPI001C6939A0|nr:lamin tail domain-containing protein [Leucobacter luti]QYM76544.1 lamin tail domain-containing protein [Leucobacter luti]